MRKQETEFLRGYASTFGGGRRSITNTEGAGESLKNNLAVSKPGPWGVSAQMMGETIPKETNYVTLDETEKDAWGIPQIKISVGYDDNDEKMIRDFFDQFSEMFTEAGFININPSDSKQAPGLDIHEMGGVRMGNDPKTSLLNKWHQLHNCPNVFVM